jgi:putative membrane protein
MKTQTVGTFGDRRRAAWMSAHGQIHVALDRQPPSRRFATVQGMVEVAAVLVAIVAAIHVYILVLEMFLWRTPRGLKSFHMDQDFADRSATLAANQGLYNGFLAAGLTWGLLAADPVGFQAKLFFLACVIVAGLYGAATVSRRILLIQAALALVAVLYASVTTA